MPAEGDNKRYTAQATFDLPVFEGVVHIIAERDTRETVVDYALRGNPGRKWASIAPRGDPGRKWASIAPRNNPGRKWASIAPVISGDGQAIIYTAEDFTEDEFLAIQTAAQPAIPDWASRVGQVYRVTATADAPSLAESSISIGYLGRDVPDGAESWLRLYHWNGTEWQALPTTANNEANLLAAPMRGPGLYAIFAAVPAAHFNAPGWHSFGYPLPAAQPMELALKSIDTMYTMVYHDRGEGADERWRLYAPEAPDYVRDLEQLEFNQHYHIYVTEPVTLTLNPQPQQYALAQQPRSAAVPAPFYGVVESATDFTSAAGMDVIARVGTADGPVCGRGTTSEYAGDIVYRVLVEASAVGPNLGCGTVGAPVYFSIGDQPMKPVGRWDNTRLMNLTLTRQDIPPAQWLYLPLIVR
jgi:hypothetical protein